jgi:hypothetical protein
MLPFATVMETIAFLFIAVRLISRMHPTHAGGQIGIDDLFIVIGWVVQIASIVLIVQRMSLLAPFQVFCLNDRYLIAT